MKRLPVFTHPHVGFSRFIQPSVVEARTVAPGNATLTPDVVKHRPCGETLTCLSFYLTLLLSKPPNAAGCILKQKNLPSEQKQPLTHCSVHTLFWGRLQASGHAVPHSLYRMLKGHLFSVQHSHCVRSSERDRNRVKRCKCVWLPHSSGVLQAPGFPPA